MGCVFSDYKTDLDLHIGVTDSQGKVMEYDRQGLLRDRRHLWGQCLIIHQSSGEEAAQYWDQTLNCVVAQDCWTPHRCVVSRYYQIESVHVVLDKVSNKHATKFTKNNCHYYILIGYVLFMMICVHRISIFLGKASKYFDH